MNEMTSKALLILVRDGTMYFFFIFLANLMNTLIFFVRHSDFWYFAVALIISV